MAFALIWMILWTFYFTLSFFLPLITGQSPIVKCWGLRTTLPTSATRTTWINSDFNRLLFSFLFFFFFFFATAVVITLFLFDWNRQIEWPVKAPAVPNSCLTFFLPFLFLIDGPSATFLLSASPQWLALQHISIANLAHFPSLFSCYGIKEGKK